MPDHTFARMRALPQSPRLRLLPIRQRAAEAARSQHAGTQREFDPSAVRIRWRRRGRRLSVYFEDQGCLNPSAGGTMA
jgi:hypothetical protein